MPLSDSIPTISTESDADLVAATLAGDRAAFGRIVERYQRLLCSLAYSATGKLSQSEDLAQEAFVEAWRKLGTLREPEKLRSWLCGILRFKVSRLRREDGREPVQQASEIAAAHAVESAETPASEVAIQNEEQAIMWNALERVPAIYREPLILYYREHQSVEHVAVSLDLTEDTVKQRLARGRKILQEQVMAFVEGALVRSTPGRVFTIAVLAALPEFATPAKAIGLGAAAAHGSVLAKSTGLAALLASVSGLVSAVITLRTNLEQARTTRERRAIVKLTIAFFLAGAGYIAAVYGLRAAAFHWWESRAIFTVLAQGVVIAFVVMWPIAIVRMMHAMRVMRSSERRDHPESFSDPRDQVGSTAGFYRSRWKLFGVPLVHIRFSSPDEKDAPVFGWLAGGDRAYGLLMAWGGWAIAPISVGAVSVGFLSVGTLSFGVISLGTVSVGLLALGCTAIGVKAFAWLSSMGWHTAQGSGFAIARTAAEGPIAFANHANDSIARKLLTDPHAEQNQMIFWIVVCVLSLLPVTAYARAVRRRLGKPARH